jgi:hypothetical protein
MPEPDQVQCNAHGRQPISFACTHIAHGLLTGTTPGFVIAPEESAEAYPLAWCSDCEAKIGEVGWKPWVDEWAEFKLLCGVCYLEARDLARDAGSFRELGAGS